MRATVIVKAKLMKYIPNESIRLQAMLFPVLKAKFDMGSCVNMYMLVCEDNRHPVQANVFIIKVLSQWQFILFRKELQDFMSALK